MLLELTRECDAKDNKGIYGPKFQHFGVCPTRDC
jgi:hypothetical protein